MQNQGIVGIGLKIDYQKSLQSMVNDFQQTLTKISNSAKKTKFEADIKDQIKQIKDEIAIMSEGFKQTFEEINSQTINTDNFEKYQAKVSKEFDKMKGSISGVSNQISELGQKIGELEASDIATKIKAKFDDISQSVKNTYEDLQKVVDITKTSGGALSAKLSESATKDYKETLDIIKRVRKETEELSFDNIDDSSLNSNLEKQYEFLQDNIEAYRQLKKEVTSMSKSDTGYAERLNELRKFSASIYGAYDALEKLNAISSERTGSINTKYDKMLNSLDTIDNMSSMDSMLEKWESGINKILKKSKNAFKEIQGTFSTFQLKDGAIHIPIDIATENSELKNKINTIVKELGDYIEGKPIIAKVKLVLDGNDTKGRKKNIDFDEQQKDGQKKKTVDLASTVQKTVRDGAKLAEETVNAAIKTIEKELKEVPVKIKPDTDAFKKDLKAMVDDAFKAIAEDTTGLNVNSELEKLVENLKEVSSSLSGNENFKFGLDEASIERITAAIRDMADMIQRAFGVASNEDIDAQWGAIASKFKAIAGENDNLPKRTKEQKTAVQELAAEYKKYLDMGGKEDLSTLTKNRDSIRKIKDEYEKLNVEVKETQDVLAQKGTDVILTPTGESFKADAEKILDAINLEKEVKLTVEGKSVGDIQDGLDKVLTKAEIVQNAVNQIPQAEGTGRAIHWTSPESALAKLSNPNGIKNTYGTINSFVDVLGEAETASRAIVDNFESLHHVFGNKVIVIDIPLDELREFQRGFNSSDFIPREYIKGVIDAVDGTVKLNNEQKEVISNQEKLNNTQTSNESDGVKDALKNNKSLAKQAEKTAKALEEEGNVVKTATERFAELAEQKKAATDANLELGIAAEMTTKALKEEMTALKEAENKRRTNKKAVNAGVYESNASAWQSNIKQSLLDSGNYEEVYGGQLSRLESGVVKYTAAVRDSEGAWKKLTATINSSGDIQSTKLQDLTEKQILKIEKEKEAAARMAEKLAGEKAEPISLNTSEMEMYHKDIQKILDDLGELSGTTYRLDITNDGKLLIAKKEISDTGAEAKALTATIDRIDDIFEETAVGVVVSSSKIEQALNGAFGKTKVSTSIKDLSLKDNKLGKIIDTDRTFKDINEVRANIDSLFASLGKVNERSIRVTGTDKLTAEVKMANGEIHKMKVSLDSKDFARYVDAGIVEFGKLRSVAEGVFKGIRDMVRIYLSPQDFIRYFRQGFDTVKEIDTAMTELKKVSDAPMGDIVAYFDDATESAKELGSSVKDMISATADWSRLGYNLPDSRELGEVAVLYKNVGDGIDIDTANESLVSTIQGFQLQAKDAMSVIDSFNEVSNNYAISSAGIGEALKRSAAAFNAANTDLNQSIALITAGNEIVQSPEKVGTMWQTVSARIRGTKTELEELGEDTENVLSSSKLRSLVKAYTDVDIMKSANEYKDIYTIISEIGEKWKDLKDVERAALLEGLAGKKQSNTLAAVLNNAERLEDIYQTAEKSAGSAQREQLRYTQSLQYSLDQLTAHGEKFWNTFINKDDVKDFIDLINTLISGATKLVDVLGSIPTVAGILSGFSSLKGGGLFQTEQNIETGKTKIKPTGFGGMFSGDFFKKQSIVSAEDIAALNKYNEGIIALGEDVKDAAKVQEVFDSTMSNTSKTAQHLAKSANGATVEISNIPKVSRAATVGVKALSVAMNVGLSIAISVLISGITKMIGAFDEMSQAAADATATYKEQSSSIEEYKDKITELRTELSSENISYADARDKRSQLLDIQEQLIDTYGAEAKGIDLVNGSLDDQIGKLDKLNAAKRQEWENEVNKLSTGQKWQKWGGYFGISALSAISEMFLPGSGLFGGLFKNQQKWLDNFDNTTNIERIAKKVENFKKTVNLSGLDLGDKDLERLKKQLESYEGVSFKGNKMTIAGDAKTVAETVTKIQTQVIGSRKDLQSLDQDLKDVYNSAKKIVDANWDTYNQAIENQIVADKQGVEYYGKLTAAAEAYQEAKKDGDESAMNKAKEDYSKLLSEISNSKMNETWKKFFVNMYPDVSEIINSWKFEVNIVPKINDNKNGLKDDIGAVKGLTTDTIQSAFDNNGTDGTVTSKQWKAITNLNKEAQANGLDLSTFLEQLREAGYLVSELDKNIEKTIKDAETKYGNGVDWNKYFKDNSIDSEEELDAWNKITEGINNAEDAMKAYTDSIKEAEDATAALEALNQSLDNIQSAYDKVKSAIDEYNEEGYISVDTFQTLMELEPEYLQYLTDEEGNLNLNTEAMNNYTYALIDNMAQRQIDKIVEYVNSLDEEELQQYLTKEATDKATSSLADYIAMVMEAQIASGKLSEEGLASLQQMFNNVASWAEQAKAGIGQGGFSSSGRSSGSNKKDLEKRQLEAARDYADKVADIQADLAEKEADFAEKMAEAWKEEHLAQLKDGLEKQKDLIDRYKKNVEVLDFGLDYVEPDDFANRSDMLSSKLDKLRSYGMAMRQEFERVTQIVPQTGDEAVVLADRIEELGSAMRENVTAIRETSVELQKLSIDMASTLIENRMGELQSIMDNIDKNISILRSDYRDDYAGIEEMLFMDSLLPVSSEYDKKRKEKQKADKKLIKTEQETQDEINEIVSKSLEMQAKQNAEAREKERQKLIEDMQKAREDAQKKLAEAHQDYLDFLNENEIATSDSIQAITDMFANAHIALPEIDTSSVDRAISKVQSGVDNILSMTSAMASIGGGDASSLDGSGSGSGSGSGTTSSSLSGSVVDIAKTQLGVPYVWGGTTPGKGLDCSGLTQWAYGQAGVNLPRVAQDQWNVNTGTRVSFANLRVNDQVFFTNSTAGGKVTHTGIYVGNGQFIHAPQTGDVVKISTISSANFVGAKRYAKGTKDYGVAGENYKKEYLIDKETGEWTAISSPTLIDTDKVEVVGEKTSAKINRPLPMYALGTNPHDRGKAFVQSAAKYKGTPYVWGGKNKQRDGGLDCSGLVYSAFKDVGIDYGVLNAQGYRRYGKHVDGLARALMGDLLFFGSPSNATHVGFNLDQQFMLHSSGGSSNTRSNPGLGVSTKLINSRSDLVEIRRYADGTENYGVAGENYKKEYLVDKETGVWTEVNSPTLIDTNKVDVVGEKAAAKINRPLPMFANGTWDYFDGWSYKRGKRIVAAAGKYWGTPYVWGGYDLSHGGFDCSGFVCRVLWDMGCSYPRTNAQGLRRHGQSVSGGLASAFPGDVIFFGSPSNATHVGINTGDNVMIHSSGDSSNTRSNPGRGVRYDAIKRKDIVEVRRYANGTANYGVAGENYKKEFLVDKKTGEWTEINSPTLIDTNKVDVIGEKDSAQIGKPLPMYANGTPTTDQELLSIVNTVSGQTGVPANVLLSVIDQETGSKWYGAVMDSNGYNSYGYMMINDIHINSLNSSYASQVRNDPYTNVLEGAKILASNYDKLGNWADAASAYNQGMGGFQRNGRNQYGNDVWNRANTQAFVNAANSLSGSGSYTGGQASSDVESSGGGQVSVFGFTTYFDPGEEHGDLVDYSVAFERAGLDYSGQVVVGPNGMIYPIEYLIKLFSPAQLQKWYKQVKDGVDFSQYDIPVTMANSLYGDPREFEPFGGSSSGSSKDKSSESSAPASKSDIEAFYDKAVDAIQKIESKYILDYTKIINDETLGNFEKTEALYNLLYEMGIESKDAGMLIYNELYDYFTKWLDDVENGTEEWSVEVYQAYRETLRDIIDDANERVTMAVEKKQEAADMRWDNSSGWIEDRNYYGDWALFRDNEVAAWERVVKWLHEEYPNESGKMQEAEQYLFAARKKELETATSFGNTYLESKKTLLQSYYDVTNSIAEAQHEINKELETSMTMYEYLDEDTRKLLFNQEDYNVLAEELVDIQYKANKLQRQYENDLSNASLATAESITANYQRQYETLMKSYEIAKADLEVAKKKQALNNVLNERNVRMFVNGSWQWVANTQSVADAKSALADAEFAKQKEETGLTQQNSLDNLTKQQDNLSVTMKLLETGVISLKEAVEMAAGAMSSWRFPKDIQQMLWNAAVDTESYVQGSSSRSHEGVWYDTLVDYMAEIPNADSEREAIAYNEARTAKIKGEGLEYDTLTNKEASEKWEIADNNRRYKNLFDSFSKENKGVSFQKLFPEFSNESKSNIFSNLMGEGVAFTKLFPDYFDEVSKKMNASWDASLNVGFNGTNQQTQDNRTIIHNQDNRTIVDNLTIEGATGQALANALRNELHTT